MPGEISERLEKTSPTSKLELIFETRIDSSNIHQTFEQEIVTTVHDTCENTTLLGTGSIICAVVVALSASLR